MQKWREKRAPQHPLSESDWRVVEMARTDGARSFNPDGLIANLWRIVGMPVPHGLANHSLEALRRFSVRAWHWDVIRTSDVHRFSEAGYSSSHLRQIIAHVASVRGFTPSLQDDSPEAYLPTGVLS